VILKRLSPGDGEPILVADFQPFSDAPCLSGLLAGLAGAARPVYQVDAVGALSAGQAYLSVSALAAASVREFLADDPGGQVTVVGHCSAAALALHIARLLAPGRDVVAVLVQPTWPDDEHVRIRFGEFLANVNAGDPPCPDLDAEPAACVAEMERVLREALIELAESMDLGSSADPFLDLLTWYRAWLSFLLACKNDSPGGEGAWPAAVRVLTDAVGVAEVPGQSADRWQSCPVLQPGQGTTATPELAGLVLAQVGVR
jgi:hypothetical protein